jgi:hypothetical protein
MAFGPPKTMKTFHLLVLSLALAVAACGSDTPQNTTGCGAPGNPGNSKGIGRYCTRGAGQCTNLFLYCTVDFVMDPGTPQYCTGPCTLDSDCGEGAYCSGSGLGSMGCMPAVCGGHPMDAGADAPQHRDGGE